MNELYIIGGLFLGLIIGVIINIIQTRKKDRTKKFDNDDEELIGVDNV